MEDDKHTRHEWESALSIVLINVTSMNFRQIINENDKNDIIVSLKGLNSIF